MGHHSMSRYHSEGLFSSEGGFLVLQENDIDTESCLSILQELKRSHYGTIDLFNNYIKVDCHTLVLLKNALQDHKQYRCLFFWDDDPGTSQPRKLKPRKLKAWKLKSWKLKSRKLKKRNALLCDLNLILSFMHLQAAYHLANLFHCSCFLFSYFLLFVTLRIEILKDLQN